MHLAQRPPRVPWLHGGPQPLWLMPRFRDLACCWAAPASSHDSLRWSNAAGSCESPWEECSRWSPAAAPGRAPTGTGGCPWRAQGGVRVPHGAGAAAAAAGVRAVLRLRAHLRGHLRHRRQPPPPRAGPAGCAPPAAAVAVAPAALRSGAAAPAASLHVLQSDTLTQRACRNSLALSHHRATPPMVKSKPL